MKIVVKFIVIFLGSSWILTSLLFVATLQALVTLGAYHVIHPKLASSFLPVVFGLLWIDLYYLIMLFLNTIFTLLWSKRS